MDKKFEHVSLSAGITALWDTQKAYEHKYDQYHHGKGIYSIDTPPPTVSGTLHMGHIFSYVHTDIIARYKRLAGYTVLYPMGFDDNGLATIRFVEKERGISGATLSRADFINECLVEVGKAEQGFEQLWKSIGLSVDWSKIYSTISPQVQKISQQSFLRLLDQKKVYRKEEPSIYCTTCRTSVAQAELEDQEVASVFYTLKFAEMGTQTLLIGTTRPELLSSCVALLYNPLDTRYQFLAGKKVTVPLFGNEVPVFADDRVVPEKGTGLVMCCTFGDRTDIEWYKTFSLPYRQSIGGDGKWLESTGLLAGLKAAAARQKVIELLQEQERVIESKNITHAVNVHERCKNQVEYLALRQWFVGILPLKQQLLDSADWITWQPESMKNRYIDWVKNLEWDWCISRQRFFGIPFPVWYCTQCGTAVAAQESMLPLDPQIIPCPYKQCLSCGSTEFKADTDVMDTWNTSSLSPYIVASLYQPETDVIGTQNHFFPMSLRPHAHDIIRTWTFYTMVKMWLHDGKIPWHTIAISGHVLAANKEKLSKSAGNSIFQPIALLQKYPADVVRHWSARAALGADTPLTENQLSIGNRLLVKLWNVFLFIETHGEFHILDHAHDGVNQWILHRLTQVSSEYQELLERYEHTRALEIIERFFYDEWCDDYLEYIKDRFFRPERYTSHEVQEAKRVLSLVGLRLLQLFSPYIPFITESIYQQLYVTRVGHKNLVTFCYDKLPCTFIYEDTAVFFEKIRLVISAVRKFKSEQQLSLKTPIILMITNIQAEQKNLLMAQQLLLQGVTQAVEIQYQQESKTNESKLVDGVLHCTIAYN